MLGVGRILDHPWAARSSVAIELEYYLVKRGPMTAEIAHPSRDRSAAVKAHIRDSARRLFTNQGFDATGIREIAADADVNPATVIHHFGSKERLFIGTVELTSSWPGILEGALEEIGERTIRSVLREGGIGLKGFGMTVRASDRPEIRARLRESMVAMIADPLTQRIDAPDAQLRAHLFAAQLVGLMTALSVYDDTFLLESPSEDIIVRYGASLQHMLTGGLT